MWQDWRRRAFVLATSDITDIEIGESRMTIHHAWNGTDFLRTNRHCIASPSQRLWCKLQCYYSLIMNFWQDGFRSLDKFNLAPEMRQRFDWALWNRLLWNSSLLDIWLYLERRGSGTCLWFLVQYSGKNQKPAVNIRVLMMEGGLCYHDESSTPRAYVKAQLRAGTVLPLETQTIWNAMLLVVRVLPMMAIGPLCFMKMMEDVQITNILGWRWLGSPHETWIKTTLGQHCNHPAVIKYMKPVPWKSRRALCDPRRWRNHPWPRELTTMPC